MLNLHSQLPEDQSTQASMDYSAYLLSASPPSSSFDLIGFSSHKALSQYSPSSLNNSSCSPPVSFQSIQMAQPNFSFRKKNLKPIITKSDSACSSDSEGEFLSGAESPSSPSRPSKKVSFADHKGFALAQVRLVKESPDEPPRLNPELISALTNGANADISDDPPIKLCFPQPASDYLAFRDKINNDFVSLENVIIRDYSVEGTIKVSNISFEKRVYIRFSSDEWVSSNDHEATFVKNIGFREQNDTFSFTIDISPTFDISKKLQFAVCFEENGIQHWDNNKGKNYIIVSEHFDESLLSRPASPPMFERFLPEKRTDTWSEFSFKDSTSSSPYY